MLLALPGGRTRLIVRYRGMGYVVPAMHVVAPDAPLLSRGIAFVVTRVPGIELLARAVDFFIGDALHHYMETGMLKGSRHGPRERAARAKSTPVRVRLMASRADRLHGWRRAALVGIKTVHTAAFFSIGSCLVYLAYSGLTKRSD